MIRVLISASIMAAMIGAVEAAPKCAPGKIYRVSKKVCVDKTDAVRHGIFNPRQKASAARNGAKQALLQKRANETPREISREASRETARITQIHRAQAGVAAPDDAPPKSKSAGAVVLAPVKNVIGWATSPFGALVDPWTSDSFSSAPETSFSLRLSTAD